jgi:hypothetical protein
MSILSDILKGYDDRKISDPIPTPEWPELDGKLCVKKLDPVERHEFWDAIDKRPELGSGPAFEAFLVESATVHADGSLVFEPGSWEWLQHKDPDAIRRLMIECDRLNLVTGKASEELTKNSEAPEKSEST